MEFWDDFLEHPPFEATSPFRGNPEDSHIVLWRGHELFDVKELWDMDAGIRWHGTTPSIPNFLKYGGETLCGLKIESGENMYGPRWFPFRDYIGEGREDPALLDMHGVTCMVCRNKLMFGMSKIIRRLSHIRDSVGEDYVGSPPLVHGKKVLSQSNLGNGITSEAYQYRCSAAQKEVNPRMVDETEGFGLITCQDCIDSIRAEFGESLPTWGTLEESLGEGG